MNRYEKGQIYKIVSPDFEKCYISSTCEKLSMRMVRHRHQYNSHNKGKHGRNTSFDIFDEYGIDNCKTIWIKDTPVITKRNWKQEKDITLRRLNVSTKLLLEERRKGIERKTNKEKNETNKIYRENNTVSN